MELELSQHRCVAMLLVARCSLVVDVHPVTPRAVPHSIQTTMTGTHRHESDRPVLERDRLPVGDNLTINRSDFVGESQ